MEIEKILKVSEQIFFAKRYSDVKLDVLAEKLNIKKPTLYYYFKDKKKLFEQTLVYSSKKYIKALNEVLSKRNFDEFLFWYLLYPQKNKNLFGIAFQKWYCIDTNIKSIITLKKHVVYSKIKDFLIEFKFSQIRIYLLIKLLEKIVIDNCIDWNCLKYDTSSLVKEIKECFK